MRWTTFFWLCYAYQVNGQPCPTILWQNSFEERTCCPAHGSHLFCSPNWQQGTTGGTADLHNYLCYPPQAMPPNMLPPPDGNGFAGEIILTTNPLLSDSGRYYEYLSMCLPITLQQGVSYTMSFRIGSFPFESRVNCIFCPCGNGNIFYSDINITLYGAATCQPPQPTFACPSSPFIAIDSVNYIPESNWSRLSMTFTPPTDITNIIIGAPCFVDASYYTYWSEQPCMAYFVFDDFKIGTVIDCDDNNPCTIDRCD